MLLHRSRRKPMMNHVRHGGLKVFAGVWAVIGTGVNWCSDVRLLVAPRGVVSRDVPTEGAA